MTDWTPEIRDVPVELEQDYDHEVYPPAATRFADWTTQLEASTREALRLYMAGGTGDINYRDTEIGGE